MCLHAKLLQATWSMAMNLIYLGKGMELVSVLLLASSVALRKHFYFIVLRVPPRKLSAEQQKFAELLCTSSDSRHQYLQMK